MPCILSVMDSSLRKVIVSDKAPKAVGPYSQAIVAGNLVFVSGQLGIDTNGELAPTVAEQARLALNHITSILKASGSDIPKAVKMTVFLKNIADYSTVNEVYATFFPENPPARVAVEVANLPKNALCEIDCIALVT